MNGEEIFPLTVNSSPITRKWVKRQEGNGKWKMGKKVKGKRVKRPLYGISRFVGAEWHFCPTVETGFKPV